MKLNTLLITAACAGTLLATSCNPSAKENQLKYTHTTLVDGDAYTILQIVGEKLPYELEYAKYAENAASSAEAKQLAGKVREVFADIIPALDTLATRYQVDFPIRGAKEFTAPSAQNHTHVNVAADSTASTEEVEASHHATSGYSDEGYIHHVQHELATVKEQFKRLSRNTNKDLRDYAVSKLETIKELYVLAGGKEDENAHH